MGIIVTKHKYKPIPTINYKHTQNKKEGAGDVTPPFTNRLPVM